MKRNWIIIGVVAIVVIIAAIFGLSRMSASAATTTTRVQTATVTRGNLVATVSAAGNISAPEDAALAFQQSGRVSKVNVQVGDAVKKGQLLMEIDTTDLELSLRTSQATLTSSQANFESAKLKNAQNANQLIVAKTQLDKATIALQKAQNEYNAIAWRGDVGMTTQAQTLQTATIDYQSALANYQIQAANINDTALKQAEAQLERDTISVEQAKRNIERARIYAPFDGVVSQVNFSVGDSAGTGTAVIVVDLAQLQVRVTIAEVDIAKIKVGQSSQITMDALPGRTYSARIIAISPVATITQGVVNYSVIANLTNNDGAVKPGMTSNLSITVDQRENVLLVPLRAVRAQGNQRTVTVQHQGQDIALPVTVGLTNDQFAEITSPGLQVGDQVVIQQTQTRTTAGGGGGMLGFQLPIGGPGGGR